MSVSLIGNQFRTPHSREYDKDVQNSQNEVGGASEHHAADALLVVFS